ncbi:MAG: 2-keto-4-pentenoate hydratase/2-oxohepta-3-ene-1,7-dioic acid hydratase in catechol pathway [Alphaproteobacteria bacterium]|jgi:2-keto-4-pentenoate hydratase/2-oxohepta-3-ene-1,7-dioic acid hydratase in catechol pathway
MVDFMLLNYVGEKGEEIAGIKVGDNVIPVAEGLAAQTKKNVAWAHSTKTILRAWDQSKGVLNKLADAAGDGAVKALALPLSSVTLLAPILYPDGIFCAFANFTDHMKEMSDRSPPDKATVRPLHFIKLGAHCVIGPEEEVELPAFSQQVDWEAELAVVIGRPARNVKAADAMDYVAGYTILNDLSLRDQGSRKDWNVRHDFLSGKSFDTGAPMGPWIVPADQIKDVYKLKMKQWVSGRLQQDSDSSFMHFTIAEQIEELSRRFTLRPGDVISTGSPSGNGRPQGIYLKPGDELLIEIDEIGKLHNPIVQGE